MGIGSVVFGQRFAQDRLGLILSGSYYDHQLGSDNIEAEWNDDGNGAFVEEFQIREYQIQRIRRSVSAALDFRLDDANTVTWRSMYNHRDDWENRFRLVIKVDEPDGAGNTMAEVERQSKEALEPTASIIVDSRINVRRATRSAGSTSSAAFSWSGPHSGRAPRRSGRTSGTSSFFRRTYR